MTSISIAVACGILVGLSLGLTGGGGSIFAVPLLIYLVGLDTHQAISVSLAGVACTSMFGAATAIRARLVVWPPALMFAVGGGLGAPVGWMMARYFDANMLLFGFSTLAILVSASMWVKIIKAPQDASVVRSRPVIADAGPVCRLSPEGRLRFTTPCAAVLAASGVFTGLLSGLFGVGGGFLIVPALASITQMGIHRAVATSLVIIAAIGLSGALATIWTGQLPWATLGLFITGGAIGMALGRRVAAKVSGSTLQKVFATSVAIVGLFVLLRTYNQ